MNCADCQHTEHDHSLGGWDGTRCLTPGCDCIHYAPESDGFALADSRVDEAEARASRKLA